MSAADRSQRRRSGRTLVGRADLVKAVGWAGPVLDQERAGVLAEFVWLEGPRATTPRETRERVHGDPPRPAQPDLGELPATTGPIPLWRVHAVQHFEVPEPKPGATAVAVDPDAQPEVLNGADVGRDPLAP
ncbi:MAG: hypothetical protein AB1Z98_36180, partial [Nannocystaceae bacterium]